MALYITRLGSAHRAWHPSSASGSSRASTTDVWTQLLLSGSDLPPSREGGQPMSDESWGSAVAAATTSWWGLVGVVPRTVRTWSECGIPGPAQLCAPPCGFPARPATSHAQRRAAGPVGNGACFLPCRLHGDSPRGTGPVDFTVISFTMKRHACQLRRCSVEIPVKMPRKIIWQVARHGQTDVHREDEPMRSSWDQK